MRTLLGVLLALVIAAGVGVALPGIIAQLASPDEAPPRESADVDWLVASAQRGVVERFGPQGWRRLQPGAALSPPLRLRTGPGADLGLRSGALSVALSEGSELKIGRPSAAGTTVELVTGAVILSAAQGRVHARLSGAGVDALGSSYGVSYREGQIELSVLAGELSFSAPKLGSELKVDAPGRLSFSRGRVITGALADRLEIRPMSSKPRGSSFRFQAMSSPGSQVWIRVGAKYQRVATNSEGRFTVLIEQEAPAPGQILLRDTLGRVAELNHPSRTLAALLSDLRAGRLRGAAPSEEAPAAQPETPQGEAQPKAPAPAPTAAPAEPPKAQPAEPEPAKREPVKPPSPKEEPSSSAPAELQLPPPEEGPIEVAPIGDEGEEEEDAERGL